MHSIREQYKKYECVFMISSHVQCMPVCTAFFLFVSLYFAIAYGNLYYKLVFKLWFSCV